MQVSSADVGCTTTASATSAEKIPLSSIVFPIVFSATIAVMLTPSDKPANRFRKPFKPVMALAVIGLTAACLQLTGVAATADVPDADGPHKVGLADSRVGYESVSYVTDSKVVIQTLGKRQPLYVLSMNPPLGLPRVSRRLDPEEIDLGRQLFFDRRLSKNETLSCAMCHIPEQGFTQNELATPVGHLGKGVRRNVPSLYNVAFAENLFLDGREQSLEAQIWSPLLAENEMANDSREAVLAKLALDARYMARFAEVFNEGLTEASLGRALAAYQRALLSGDSAFDRWYFGGETAVRIGLVAEDYPALAARGFTVFQDKGCASCHRLSDSSALFTDGEFHNTGTGYRRAGRALRPPSVQLAPGVFVVPTVDAETETFTDDGRYEVTGREVDKWRYRTPSLRNVALTSPYMHDGSIATLEEVVAFYAEGGGGDPAQDPRTRSVQLTETDQEALVAFLQTLTSSHVDALVSDARSVTIGERAAGGQ
jgi:cytochrome c peroxidase